MQPQVISYSGSHGVGKSFAATNMMLHQKFTRPKKSVTALCDLEASCPYSINDGMTEESQMWLFGNQIAREQSALAIFDIVITDRTIVDIIAYTFAAGFHNQAQGMLCYAGHHIQIYKEIFFKRIAYNNHLYDDGIRDAKDVSFRQDVEDNLDEFYQQLSCGTDLAGKLYYV